MAAEAHGQTAPVVGLRMEVAANEGGDTVQAVERRIDRAEEHHTALVEGRRMGVDDIALGEGERHKVVEEDTGYAMEHRRAVAAVDSLDAVEEGGPMVGTLGVDHTQEQAMRCSPVEVDNLVGWGIDQEAAADNPLRCC